MCDTSRGAEGHDGRGLICLYSAARRRRGWQRLPRECTCDVAVIVHSHLSIGMRRSETRLGHRRRGLHSDKSRDMPDILAPDIVSVTVQSAAQLPQGVFTL